MPTITVTSDEYRAVISVDGVPAVRATRTQWGWHVPLGSRRQPAAHGSPWTTRWTSWPTLASIEYAVRALALRGDGSK